MALNMDAIGQTIGPISKDYTWENVVLYALGVGAGFDDLEYCYEKNLKVIPSFSIAAIFEFLMQFGIKSGINLAGVLHGEQELIFHNPIPTEGTLTTEGKLTDYYDKGKNKGALIIGKSETHHSNGKKLFTSTLSIFARKDGGFGGPEAPKKVVEIPDRDPDFIVDALPAANQPLLYRLSGDIFALHADPGFAQKAGFEKPIMHGLCTHGYACRALIDSLVPGEPEKARRMYCRFSKTLYPGTAIQILIWKTEDGTAVWRVISAENGDVIIDMGEFEYGDIPDEQIRFDDRVAIVTGAGAGLGKIYALELAQRGAKVVVNDLGGARDGSGKGSSSPADEVVKEIQALGGEAVANYDNVATVEGGQNVVQSALDAFGTVDIVINNAGILRDKSIIKMDPEDWKAVIAVHLNGAYNVSRPAFAVMKDKSYGRIVMTTSAAGLYGNFGQANYSAAKMALVGLMNALKIEGKKYDVKVNTVAPVAASRLTEDVLPPDLFKKMKPEFVAPLTLYLCSEQCPVSGNIYNAGMGFYNRAAVVTGPGAVVGGNGEIPTVEDIESAMAKIGNLEGGKEYFQLNDQAGDLLNALSGPPGESAGSDGGGYATAASVFEDLPGAFVAEAAAGVDVVFQYIIEGDGGGDWICTVKDGTCDLKKGRADNATCTLKIGASDFLDMNNGKLQPMQAYTSGKLTIEGDVMKSQLIDKLFKK